MKRELYVYRFLKGNEILYIGRTNNLKVRFSNHATQSAFFNEADRWEFIEFDNSVDQRIAEAYLINKCKPKYNTEFNFDDTPSSLEINIPPFRKLTKKLVKEKKGDMEYQYRKLVQIREEKEALLDNGFEKLSIGTEANRYYLNGIVEIHTSGRPPIKYYEIYIYLEEKHDEIIIDKISSAKEAYAICIREGLDKYFNNKKRPDKSQDE